MNKVLFSLIQNFLLGGAIVASISYLGTFFDPLIGAIWWSFPISLLPTLFFMKKHGKDNKYIAKFTISTTYALVLLVLSTAVLAMFIKNNKNTIRINPKIIKKNNNIYYLENVNNHFQLARAFYGQYLVGQVRIASGNTCNS